MVQLMPLPSPNPSSLVSFKSRLVLNGSCTSRAAAAAMAVVVVVARVA